MSSKSPIRTRLMPQYLINIGLTIAGSLVILATFMLLYTLFDLNVQLMGFIEWLSTQGLTAIYITIALNSLIVVLLMPGVILTVASGFMFGFYAGCLYIVISDVIGASIAFFLARYFFSDNVAEYLLEHKKFRILNHEFVEHGWKLILLTRLIPFFPFKLSNYFFGLADFKYRHFFIGTFFGVIPLTAFNVYIGTLASELSHLTDVGKSLESPLGWWVYGVGFIIFVMFLTYISYLSQHAFERYQSQADKALQRGVNRES